MSGMRETLKQRTRERILTAARQLFAEQGFQKTTLRQICEAAGVAVGSVFTTFESKEDVLFEIAAERYDGLAEAIAKDQAGGGSARSRLKRGFHTAYRYEFDRLSLLMVQLGASWTWSNELETRSQARLARPFAFIGSLIQDAQSAGEIGAKVDLAVFGDMLLGIYMRNYRHAWFRGIGPEDMAALANAQIDLLFDGACPR
jgi:AcrR family transcriptional regulator